MTRMKPLTMRLDMKEGQRKTIGLNQPDSIMGVNISIAIRENQFTNILRNSQIMDMEENEDLQSMIIVYSVL